MPLTRFICPDDHQVETLACLAACRMAQRCLSTPTLRLIARQRTRSPSTTQLLDGTMLQFLLQTVDYATRPQDRAYALLGTYHHAKLADAALEDDVVETLLQEGGIEGHPDLLEPLGDDTYCLWDFKTWGSYRLAKALGMVAEKADDPSGAVYQRSGSWGRKGTPKQITLWRENPLVADIREPQLQLNSYRLMANAAGYQVARLRLQVTVRDGGLMVAKERGIEDLMRVVEVAFLPDEKVREYFTAKRLALEWALTHGWEKPCTVEERWNDDRCRRYCSVSAACPHGAALTSG